MLTRFWNWLTGREPRRSVEPMKHPEYLAVHVANANGRSALR